MNQTKTKRMSYFYHSKISNFLHQSLTVIFPAPRVQIILIAQVFNGCLLPFFSICLLLCINDEQFMGRCPQKGWHNVFLVIGVTITLLLASNVIVQKVKTKFENSQ